MPRRSIQVGAVRVEIYPWRHPSGRDYWRWDYEAGGKRKQLTGATVEKLRDAIERKLREIGGLTPLPRDLPPSVRSRFQRILDVDPELRLVEEFLEWKRSRHPDVSLHGVVAEFLAAKEQARGRSTRNLSSLRSDLADLCRHVADKPLHAVSVADLEAWLMAHGDKSAKRRLNLRGAAVTLFRWCRRRRYLPNELSAAEVLERPKVARKIPPTYTPDEMRLMLDACPRDYLPWLLLSAFCGLRYEEIDPPRKSDKDGFRFEDIDRARGVLVVRPETAKLGERRVVHLPAGLLERMPQGSGPVMPPRPVHKRVDGGSVTERLGGLVGGWRPNGLRNSFISYRAAVAGLAQAAMEAGNSESEARRSYNDAKSREEGEAWFRLLRTGR